jgi:hypothetical protein
MVGSDRSLELDGRFCVGAFGWNFDLNHRDDVFNFNSHFQEMLQFFFIFSIVCKDNVAVNVYYCSTRKFSFPLSLTGHTTLVN